MKFLERFVANAVAVYLALYLVDSVARGHFRIGAIWIAVLLALVVGLLNSLIRPLHRVRTRTSRSLIVAALTLILNALVVQVFAWATPLAVDNLPWLLLVAGFLAVLMGTINWLIGFAPPEKGRPSARITRVRDPQSSGAVRRDKASRSRAPRS